MKKVIFTLSPIFFSICLFAQEDSAKIFHARKVLELTGSGKLGVEMCNMAIASFKKEYTSIPVKFWDELSNQVDAKEFIDLYVPIYVKHFTDAELLDLIKFYQTPLGQKLIVTAPLLTKDAYVAGDAYGRVIQQRVLQKIQEKGYKTTVEN